MAYDVGIVGGGPAGLVAATLLARGGARVAVMARRGSRPPRPGETLPGAGIRLLRALDLPMPGPGGPHRRLTGIASAWDGAPVETDHFNSPDGPAWLIERAAFDGSLAAAAAAAGATLLAGTADGMAADFVIDASGRAASVGRRRGARIEVAHDLVALWSVATGDAPERLERPLIERCSDGWWFAVRLCARRTYAAFHAETAAAATWHERLARTRYLAPLLRGAGDFPPPRGSPAGGARLVPVGGMGWAACGDAAMAFDPLSSQGLLGAMAGGEMLAAALLAEDRDSALAAYRARLDDIWRIYADRRLSYYARDTLAGASP